MDLQTMYEPIVIPKPVKGREMRTAVISKDSPTVKAIPEEGVIEKARDKKASIYHEGYINGKLYLVPDSNLQAMRDIVNLKMRRRTSSKEKPRTSLEEPTQFNEFNVKLDTLLDKINKLAGESYNEQTEISSQMESGSSKNEDLTENERLRTTEGVDEMFLKDRISNIKSLPPILNNDIKYKPVRQKKEYPDEMFKDSYSATDMSYISSHSVTSSLKYNKRPMSKDSCTAELDQDIITILISGHMKEENSPIFIIQQYNGSKVLGNQRFDFLSQKKDGNIDIFLSGKFFTEDILEQDSINSTMFINLKSEKIFINENSRIHKDKFKDIFSVGSIDIALEGEFFKNQNDCKYTPKLSLEILKRRPKDIYDPPLTTVLFSRDENVSPFQGQHDKPQKHVHYTSTSVENINQQVYEGHAPKNKAKKVSLWKKIKTMFFFVGFFSKNKNERNVDSDKQLESSSRIKQKPHTIKRNKLISKGRAKDKLSKRRNQQSYDNLQIIKPSFIICREEEGPSYFQAHQTTKETAKSKEMKDVPKYKKRKKDKNQTIIENPILAQMQEFFIT